MASFWTSLWLYDASSSHHHRVLGRRWAEGPNDLNDQCRFARFSLLFCHFSVYFRCPILSFVDHHLPRQVRRAHRLQKMSNWNIYVLWILLVAGFDGPEGQQVQLDKLATVTAFWKNSNCPVLCGPSLDWSTAKDTSLNQFAKLGVGKLNDSACSKLEMYIIKIASFAVGNYRKIARGVQFSPKPEWLKSAQDQPEKWLHFRVMQT
jgi:hypothetical protein